MYTQNKAIIKIISFLLTAIMLLSAIGCSKNMDIYDNSESNSENSYSDTEKNTNATGKKQIKKKPQKKKPPRQKEPLKQTSQTNGNTTKIWRII